MAKPASVKRVLVLPDIHVPVHDDISLRAIEAYAQNYDWDSIGYLGDFMDFDSISHHSKGNIEAITRTTIEHDLRIGNELLDRHEKISANNRWLISGNHDYRAVRFAQENPQFKGLLEVQNSLHLKNRGIEFIDFWGTGQVKRIGKATFIHGLYCNDAHAKKHVQTYGTNVFYGHLHDRQLYSLCHNGDNKTLIGESLGCLCKYRQFYMRGRPNRWVQAFAVFHFFPDGYFNHYVVDIFKHRFISPEGDIYDGTKIK